MKNEKIISTAVGVLWVLAKAQTVLSDVQQSKIASFLRLILTDMRANSPAVPFSTLTTFRII